MNAEAWYDYIFAQALQQDWEVEHSLRSDLYDRKHFLNNSFTWTEQNIAALRHLNTLLAEKEAAAWAFCARWKPDADATIKAGTFDDYNLDFELHLYNDWLEGAPFFTHRNLISFSQCGKPDDDTLTTSWNDLPAPHPLSGDPHCLLFHELCDHTPLAWQDLLTVSSAWLEMKVEYQWFIESKSTPCVP